MNGFFDKVKPLLPAQFRPFLRKNRRNFIFRRAMKKFLQNPGACVQPGNPVLADLIYGWDNEYWSALDEYLAGSLSDAMKAVGATLECGSGLSTILLGVIAKYKGQTHWALEHSPEWASKVQKYLDFYRLHNVVLTVKPLRDYGEFDWYDAPLDNMPKDFALVVCDGPPSDTRGGRHGFLPVMKTRLAPDCVILLDDIARQQELDIAEQWVTELGVPYVVVGKAKPYARIIVGYGQINNGLMRDADEEVDASFA